jgi:hypothetical protein
MVTEQTGQVVWVFEAELDEEDEGMLYDEP